MSSIDVLSLLGSDEHLGLSSAEVEIRLEKYGRNALPQPRSPSTLIMVARQFMSPLIYLLLIAAIIALILHEWNDAIIIAIVLLLNAVIGALQEGKAKRALEALRAHTKKEATVVRDGKQLRIDATELVPGDIILISAGDAIVADGRLIESRNLETTEAQLTGESLPVAKVINALPPQAIVADRKNMIYAASYAVAGRGLAVVVATGFATELGQIAKLAESTPEAKTPLEKRIAQFGRYILATAALVLLALIMVGILREIPMGELLIISISQIVGLIPEGLPIAITVAHAIAVQRMAARGALVRRLSAIETLGSVGIICTDKTGTLTQNEMMVTAIQLPGRGPIGVLGSGYDPNGEFIENEKAIITSEDAQLNELLIACILCNDAKLPPPLSTTSRWSAIGDPTEAALLSLGYKGGLEPEQVNTQFKRQAEIPFASEAKMMATEHKSKAGSFVVIKGAPEAVLALCGSVSEKHGRRVLDKALLINFLALVNQMASQALRVIAVARVDDADIVGSEGFEPFSGKAMLLGFLGQIDPPRPEVEDAIKECIAAGIRPVMVTGDHKITGHAIAGRLGITGEAIDGAELENLSDEMLMEKIDNIAVFARVHPQQKMRIIGAYKARGEVVAMTGDGVNDAPALVSADVGVAMGQKGTEVAKEAAKIVITDDNFATIVKAIEQGRVVYQNIQKTILHLFTTSAAETLILFLAIALGYPLPFAAVQILWNNLVTETIITLNLVMEPAEGDEMKMRPIPQAIPLVPKSILLRMTVMTPAIIISTLGWFIVRLNHGIPFTQVQTETFTLLVVCEWFNVLNCRSRRQSALSFSLFKNPWLLGGLILGNLLHVAIIYWSPMNRLFHTTPLNFEVVLAIGVVGSLVLWVEEARKLLARKYGQSF